jgi:MurNAc alpha-1-phosphate uridylyltransferase
MILAAGRGERMRPLTEKLPKPLLEVGGHRLIAYHLASLARLGVREVVINLSWHGERIREALVDGAGHGVSIRYSEEGPEPFLVLNGDVWTDFDLDRLRAPAGSLAHLVLVDNPEHHPGGDYGLEPGGHARTGGNCLTYSGISLLDPTLFAGRAAGFLPLKPLLDAALATGRLTAQHHAGVWCDVGTPARLTALDVQLRLGQARHPVLSSPVG